MPAEVIVRFGDRLSVNCSTSSNNVLGLRFEVFIGEADRGEHVWSLIWVVGEVQQWAIEAKCSVNVGGAWCSERPNITVYSECKSIDHVPSCPRNYPKTKLYNTDLGITLSVSHIK